MGADDDWATAGDDERIGTADVGSLDMAKVSCDEERFAECSETAEKLPPVFGRQTSASAEPTYANALRRGGTR